MEVSFKFALGDQVYRVEGWYGDDPQRTFGPFVYHVIGPSPVVEATIGGDGTTYSVMEDGFIKGVYAEHNLFRTHSEAAEQAETFNEEEQEDGQEES